MFGMKLMSGRFLSHAFFSADIPRFLFHDFLRKLQTFVLSHYSIITLTYNSTTTPSASIDHFPTHSNHLSHTSAKGQTPTHPPSRHLDKNITPPAHPPPTMKLLTLNFLTCAIKTCKPLPAAFPLHIRDAELESVETDFNPLFLRNILSRLDWPALEQVAGEVGLALPANPLASAEEEEEEDMDVDEQGANGAGKRREAEQEQVGREVDEEVLRRLHAVLIETQVASGKLVCGNCGHEYAVREGIPNFLLPAHLV